MSWREIARAAVEREAADSGSETPARDFGSSDSFADAADLAEARAEREAIASIDGGLPPEWAASLSMLERPEGICAREWAGRLERVWLRADQYALEFAANGWTFADVFGFGTNWGRLDCRGAAWLCDEGRIVEITPVLVVFERPGGERTTHHKQRAH